MRSSNGEAVVVDSERVVVGLLREGALCECGCLGDDGRVREWVVGELDRLGWFQGSLAVEENVE